MECVLIRHLDADEWDVNVRNAVTTRHSQVIDDGSTNLREGQQDDVLQQHVQATIGAVAPTTEEQFQSLASSSAAPRARVNPEAAAHTEEDMTDGSDGDGNDDDEGDVASMDLGDMSIIDAVFGRQSAAASKSKAVSSNAKKAPVQKSNLKKLQTTPTKQAQKPRAQTPDQAKSPSSCPSLPSVPVCEPDPECTQVAIEYLETQQGYAEMHSAEVSGLAKLDAEPFAVHAVTSTQKKDLNAACKSLGTELTLVYKKFVQFHIKLGKRARVPDQVMSFLVAKREDLKRYTGLLAVMQEKHIEYEVMDNLMRPFIDKDVSLPLAFAVKHHLVAIQDT